MFIKNFILVDNYNISSNNCTPIYGAIPPQLQLFHPWHREHIPLLLQMRTDVFQYRISQLLNLRYYQPLHSQMMPDVIEHVMAAPQLQLPEVYFLTLISGMILIFKPQAQLYHYAEDHTQ